jgi:uncharacterized membrane protein YhaH (DUF805 family)
MNPIEAIGSGFGQYANFSGRARRSEYWWFIGFVYLSLICLSLIPILGALFYMAVFLPFLAVTARRLHDTNRSGWWMLIGGIPLVGLALLVFLLLPSERLTNEYGPNPDTSSRLPEKASEIKAIFNVENGLEGPSFIPLTQGILVLGNSDAVDIKLENQYVSRRHFQVRQDVGVFYLSDLGSTNGTYLNNNKLAPNEEHVVRDGGIVILGNNAVTLRFSGASGTIAQHFPAGVMARYCSVCGLEASKDARSCAGCGQGL